LQQYFGSASVGDVFNSMGLANPAIDALIRQVEEAHTREEMATRVRALDRALRALRFWVPQWHKATHTVAYYDMFDHPENLPPYALGELDFWWYNAEKAEKLKAAGAF
jgi:microcin C transport system substrate-binding protein